jgi:hypothetical protein
VKAQHFRREARHHSQPTGAREPAKPVRTVALEQSTVILLQRLAGNHAVSGLVQMAQQSPAPASTAGSIVVQPSLISWVVKSGAKKVSKGMLKNFINTQIKRRLKNIIDKDMAKRFGKEADDILDALEDPWWATAIGFVPVVGDAFDLARLPKQIRNAFKRAEMLEKKVERILDLQLKKAVDAIPASLKRSPSYASELEQLTYGELRDLASTDSKAAAMKKLIENQMRLMEKH